MFLSSLYILAGACLLVRQRNSSRNGIKSVRQTGCRDRSGYGRTPAAKHVRRDRNPVCYRGRLVMQLSKDRILVTHTGSLPRGEALGNMLIDDERGRLV